MKRVGIIGTGKHGSRYANHIIKDIDTLQLSGICRRSDKGREQAEQWQTRYFANWRDLIKDVAVEAVIAVVPPGINLDIAKACAVAGKPLLIEKPLARNGYEAAEIVRVMHEHDCALTVAQTLRYNPVIQSLTEQLPDMGKLYSFAVNQRIEPSSLDWHDDPDVAGSGVVIHTAVHIFDALRVITSSKIVRVMAVSRCIHSRHLEDLVTVLAEFETGVIGTVDVSKVSQARSGRFEFVCQNGQLHADQIHSFTKVIENSSIVRHKAFVVQPTILPLLVDWSKFLEGERENPITGEDGRYAVEVCDACLHSAKMGRWVEVGRL
jgi:predicted dehydrogenase